MHADNFVMFPIVEVVIVHCFYIFEAVTIKCVT